MYVRMAFDWLSVKKMASEVLLVRFYAAVVVNMLVMWTVPSTGATMSSERMYLCCANSCIMYV